MIRYDLNEFVDALNASKKYRPSTVISYENDIRHYLEWLTVNGLRVGTDIESNAQEYLDWLFTEGFRPTSIRRSASSLRKFYGYFGGPKLKGKNQRLALPRHEKTDVFARALTASNIKKVKAAFNDTTPRNVRNMTIFDLLYSCGLRISELVELKLDDIRLKEQLIRPTGKHNVVRVIPLGGRAERGLRQWVTKDRHSFLINNGVSDNSRSLFVNRWGTTMSRQSIQRMLDALGDELGLTQPLAPRMIRDTCAKEMLANGATRDDVEFLFGHVTLVGHKHMDYKAIEQLRTVLRKTHPAWHNE